MPISVSIIIPVYNGENSIEHCVNSCFMHGYENMEVFVINDGSTDNTASVLEKLCNGNNRLHIISINNSGPCIARKLGIDISCTDFVFFLDADDYLEKDSIKKLVAKQKEENCDIVVGQYNIIRNQTKKKICRYRIESENLIVDFLNQNLPFTLWPILYRKKCFDTVVFPENIFVGEDFIINSQVFSLDSLKVSILDETVYNYVRHGNSITDNPTKEKLRQNYMAYKLGIDYLKHKIVDKTQQKALLFNNLVFLTTSIKLSSPYVNEIKQNILSKNDRYSINMQIKKFSLIDRIILKLFLISNKMNGGRLPLSYISLLKKIKSKL